MTHTPEAALQRLLKPTFFAALVLLAVSWFFKGGFVEPADVRSDLMAEPRQVSSSRERFSFDYKGRSCLVRPVAEYELWGLVVSHNNIESIADIYHDSTSVDTKDLCVIWGNNLSSTDFHEVDYKSGPFTCYFSYPRGVRFDPDRLANNHLITDSSRVRDQIANVRVGDQVRLKGLLVDYQMDDWGKFWRKTSKVRTDTGCEVVFVEEVEVLQKGTPGWYLAFRIAWITLLTIPLAFLWTVWRAAHRPPAERFGLE